MINHALYKGVSSPPQGENLLDRPQIDKLFEKEIRKPLVTVVAGTGFGKTQAVSSFLRGRKAKVIWLQLSAMDNLITRYWQHLVYSLSLHNEELAAAFTILGFPENMATFSAFLQLLAEEVELNGEYFLVYDDFHLIHEKAILHMVEGLVNARIQGLSIVLISRTEPPISTMGLMSKGMLANITEDDLRFNEEETAAYFSMRGSGLSVQALSDIYHVTDGWVSAIYLISLTLKKGVNYDKIPLSAIKFDMFKLIDTELFNNASLELQKFLVKLSLIEHLRAELLQILSAHNTELLQELIRFSSFIRYDSFSRCYQIHNLFRDFLCENQDSLATDEILEVYRKAAGWYADNGYVIDAIAYYEKAGDYDKILAAFPTSFSSTLADFALAILDRAPGELGEKMPMIRVARAKFLVALFRLGEAAAELEEMKGKYEALTLVPENEALLGEIYCLLGFISLITSFTDRKYEFVQLFKMADKYLPSGSTIFDSDVHLNRGTYVCMIDAAHYEKGSFTGFQKAILDAVPYISKVTNGCGHGMEYLSVTEESYFKRDLKNAQKYAQQAIYKSQEKGQYDIENMALFYLIRINVALCNYEEIISLLDRMKSKAEKLNNKDSYAMLHIAEGWFYAAIGRTEKVQDWIIDEMDEYSEIADISFCLHRLVRARCHLEQQNYYELLAFSEQQKDAYGLKNFLIGSIEINVLKAIALYRLNEKEEAMRALQDAYTLAQPNELIMPFIEQGMHMRTLAMAAINNEACSIPAQWLEGIRVKSSTYAKKIDHITAEYQKSQGAQADLPSLTVREREILSNLCRGLTRDEISVECNLSVNTIKSMLQNIYQKLGATNSYDAIRIASKMDLRL